MIEREKASAAVAAVLGGGVEYRWRKRGPIFSIGRFKRAVRGTSAAPNFVWSDDPFKEGQRIKQGTQTEESERDD